MSDRVILHCDCNSFFASVETALNPKYKDVPMAVCGSPEDRHGIVLAKNELAKAYGIKTADTVYSARRMCPGLLVVKPHYSEYVNFSARVNAIYARYTDIIEPFGIDESWLDVTASSRLFGSGREIAEKIRRAVFEEIGITVSVGVSFNKVFAKLGSDYKKPDATTVIDRSNFKSIVYPLPVSDMLFVGSRTAEALAGFGVKTIGDLANIPVEILIDKFGKYGEMLLRYARGEDNDPVSVPCEDTKSVGNGYTFKHDLVHIDEIRSGVNFLSEEIGRRLREMGCVCSTVSVTLKDALLSVVQRQRPMDKPSDLTHEIADCAMSIIRDFGYDRCPIRSITVTAQGLQRADRVSDQMDMFIAKTAPELERNRTRKGEEAIDAIRKRFGSGSIVRGSSIENDIGISTPKTNNG